MITLFVFLLEPTLLYPPPPRFFLLTFFYIYQIASFLVVGVFFVFFVETEKIGLIAQELWECNYDTCDSFFVFVIGVGWVGGV